MMVAVGSRTDNFGDLLHFFAARTFETLSSLLRSATPGGRNGAVGKSTGRQTGPLPVSTRAFTLKENSCGVA
jgi:hypothetical protein